MASFLTELASALWPEESDCPDDGKTQQESSAAESSSSLTFDGNENVPSFDHGLLVIDESCSNLFDDDDDRDMDDESLNRDHFDFYDMPNEDAAIDTEHDEHQLNVDNSEESYGSQVDEQANEQANEKQTSEIQVGVESNPEDDNNETASNKQLVLYNRTAFLADEIFRSVNDQSEQRIEAQSSIENSDLGQSIDCAIETEGCNEVEAIPIGTLEPFTEMTKENAEVVYVDLIDGQLAGYDQHDHGSVFFITTSSYCQTIQTPVKVDAETQTDLRAETIHPKKVISVQVGKGINQKRILNRRQISNPAPASSRKRPLQLDRKLASSPTTTKTIATSTKQENRIAVKVPLIKPHEKARPVMNRSAELRTAATSLNRRLVSTKSKDDANKTNLRSNIKTMKPSNAIRSKTERKTTDSAKNTSTDTKLKAVTRVLLPKAITKPEVNKTMLTSQVKPQLPLKITRINRNPTVKNQQRDGRQK